MRTHLAVLFIWLYATGFSNAQRFDKKAFDKKYDLKSDVAYVINGVPYQPGERARIDSALGLYPIEHLVEVSKVSGMNGYKNKEVIIISFAFKQSAKQIQKSLEGIREKFTDIYPVSSQAAHRNPALWIDNESIAPEKARQVLDKLKVADIYFIDFRKDQVTTTRSTKNAGNGLVRVWMNKDAAKDLLNEE